MEAQVQVSENGLAAAKWFVEEGSVVREIWGKADTILFIFAGASAEFALNKSVDWLYFTGKLPADPLGRLFSTVAYARRIVFSEYEGAMQAIQQIAAIHKDVENKRGMKIPDWAYRDVLFMLIDYSIRSFELLERKLTVSEKAEIFIVFRQVGAGMGIAGLPNSFPEWEQMRAEHLQENLIESRYSIDLYQQYRKHLGWGRYTLLKQVQAQVCPRRVTELLHLGRKSILTIILPAYKLLRFFGLQNVLRDMILPGKYLQQILDLDVK